MMVRGYCPDNILLLGLPLGNEPEVVQRRLREVSFEILVSGVLPIAPEIIICDSINPDSEKVALETIVNSCGNKRNVHDVVLVVPEKFKDEEEFKKEVFKSEALRNLLHNLNDNYLDVYIDSNKCMSNQQELEIKEWLEEFEELEAQSKKEDEFDAVFDAIKCGDMPMPLIPATEEK